mmetsp:Transcript_8492/g.11196  ORF Transcript_8492/g.11196 Transcript_8492/m.11196 type:complete len:363 (+) Transcript_8492:88-1176(+)
MLLSSWLNKLQHVVLTVLCLSCCCWPSSSVVVVFGWTTTTTRTTTCLVIGTANNKNQRQQRITRLSTRRAAAAAAPTKAGLLGISPLLSVADDDAGDCQDDAEDGQHQKQEVADVIVLERTTATQQQHQQQSTSRRVFSSSLFGGSLICLQPFFAVHPVFADQGNDKDNNSDNNNSSRDKESEPRTLVKGLITLKEGIELPPPPLDSAPAPALYITARPNKADNVPRAVLDGSNGKPPPVLAVRIPNPIFPLQFTLQAPNDLTVEGRTIVLAPGGDDDKSSSPFWFENMDLIVSARWDTDGAAATRDPTDLVGRGIFTATNKNNKNHEKEQIVSFQLVGRGFTGKLVTGKQQQQQEKASNNK